MRVLLDLNVVLDVLLNRTPWVSESGAVWDAHRAGQVVAHVAAFTLPTTFYIVRRQGDLQRAKDGVRVCLNSLEIVPTSRSTLESAQQQLGADYEDNVQVASAIEAKLNAIVTRDPAGFAHSPIEVLTPAQLLQRLSATAGP
jgi:predicted nucleic acid-binding protein